MDLKLGLVIVGVIAMFLLYVFSYFGSRSYLVDNFANQAAAAVAGSTEPQPVEKPSPMERWTKPVVAASGEFVVAMEEAPVAPPFTDQPINSVDDYEYNYVYQNESDKPLSDAMRSKLMSQYPLDWSGYPPSAAQFQAGLRESFENATPNVPDDAKPYQNITGSLMAPPDTGSLEAEERKILMTYKPEFPPDPTAYDPADVEDLVKKIYEKRGLVPELKKREGSNVYDVVGTTKIGAKVTYEDEMNAAPASGGEAAGEGVTQGPLAAAASLRGGNGNVAGMSVAPDKFFEPSAANAAGNKWDYTAWTPGLERSFAPSEPRENWY